MHKITYKTKTEEHINEYGESVSGFPSIYVYQFFHGRKDTKSKLTGSYECMGFKNYDFLKEKYFLLFVFENLISSFDR